MLYIKDGQKVRIWKVEDKGKYSQVRFSTSRKDKASDEWVHSNWSFVAFVGDAHKKAKTLSEGDTILLKGAGVSLESYIKDGKKEYPKSPKMVVFNFEKQEESAEEEFPEIEEYSEDSEIPF